MLENLDAMKKLLSELAGIINSFKSEAVQLRILEIVIGETAPAGAGRGRQPGGRKSRVRAKAEKGVELPGAHASSKRRVPTGNGAAATLGQLVGGIFFGKPKTLAEIVEHCKHNMARTFKMSDFSGTLGRMVRSGQLKREKNADNQYAYQKP